MVKDPSDSERGNPLSPHNRIAHTTAFVTPVVEYWLEREIAQWVHPMKDRSNDLSHHERTLLPRSYISLLLPADNCKLTSVYFCETSHTNWRSDIHMSTH